MMRTIVTFLGLLTGICAILMLWVGPPVLAVDGDMDAPLPLWATVWMGTPLAVLVVAVLWVAAKEINRRG